MRRTPLVALAAVLLTRIAAGATDLLEFPGWTANAPLSGGWTQTGLVAYGASSDLVGGVYFDSTADRLASPTYDSDILSVVIELATSSASPTRTFGLYATAETNMSVHSFVPTAARRYERQTCDLSGRGLRSFVLKCAGGSGNWAVRSVEVRTAASEFSVRPVREIAVVGAGEAAFDLVWEPVEGASSYLVSVWTNGIANASPGTEVPVVWSGQDNVAWDDSGVAVVGTTVKTGSLVSAPFDELGDCRLTLEMAREGKDDTKPVIVIFEKDGIVSHSNEVSLATGVRSFREYVLDFEDVPAGSRLAVRSSPYCTSSGDKRFGRAAVRSVELARGYAPGTPTFEYLTLYEVQSNSSFRVVCRSACTVCYSVVAQFEVGAELAESSPVEGSVDMTDPPWLRYWRISDFKADHLMTCATRTANFETLRAIRSRAAWTNGRDGDGVRAFIGLKPAEAIGFNSGSSRTCGLYATTNVLSILGTGTSDVSLVLPLRLDGLRWIRGLAVSYVVRRVTDMEPTELSFAYRLADELGEVGPGGDGWINMPSAATAATDGPESKTVELPASECRRSKYVLLRWRVPQAANSSMMGLSDLNVTVRYPRRGLSLSFR